MIILFDEHETNFTSLGIGILSDAVSCKVTEDLTGYFELEMEYPISGTHYKDIKHKRIILASANDVYENSQPFRIYKITKPINGIVTIYAEHISYDTARIPVKKVWANNLTELKALLENSQDTFITKCNFNFITDKTSDMAFETKKPMSYRSLLLGDDNSILSVYGGEYIFDRFNITLVTSRGKETDFTVRYSKNMLDFEQEITSDVLYTGVMPYYSNEVTENKTGMVQNYTVMYLSEEALASNVEERLAPENYTDPETGETYEIFPDKFFCYDSEKAKGFILSLLNTPNIISAGTDPENPNATYTYPDGTKKSFLNHIFIGKKIRLDPSDPLSIKKCYVDVTGVMAYIRKNAVEFSEGWLSDSPDNLTTPIVPEVGKIYRIFSDDKNHKYKAYSWDITLNKYVEWLGDDGNGDPYKPKNNTVSTEQETSDVLVTLDENIVYINEVRCKIAMDPITIIKNSDEYRQYTLNIGVEKEKISLDNSKTTELGYNVYSYYNSSVKTTYLFSLNNSYQPYSIMSYVEMLSDKKASEWITQEIYDASDLLYINKRYNEDPNKFSSSWLKSQKWDTIKAEFVDDENPISAPKKDTPYTIFSKGMFYGKTYYWNGTQYISSEDLNLDQRILTVDLTDKFQQEPPNQIELYNETVRYIKDNEIGVLKDSIKVSFVKLSSTPEYSKWKELEKVNLGDTVIVIYSAYDISVKKRVIKTVYNVLKESYDEIELGKKSASFTSNVMMTADNVSNLSNDRNFTEYSKVTELIAESITAEKIKAFTAEITQAQIEQLEVAQINISGCIQATSLEIDELIAGLIVTDNAAIRNQLTVGEGVIVNGEINIKSGSISIVDDNALNYVKVYIDENATEYSSAWLKEKLDSTSPIVPQENVIYKVYDNHNIWTQEYYTWSTDDQKYDVYDPNNVTMFEVDKEGNLYANSVTITGGSITIQNSDDDTTFEVNNKGELFANSVELTGKITATAGLIGDCSIVDGHLEIASANIESLNADKIIGGTIRASSILLLSDSSSSAYSKFRVTEQGALDVNSVSIDGGEIKDLHITGKLYFGDQNNPKVTSAYARTNGTFPTSDWLSLSSPNGEALHPELNAIYKVKRLNYSVGYYTYIHDIRTHTYKYISASEPEDPDFQYFIDEYEILLPGMHVYMDPNGDEKAEFSGELIAPTGTIGGFSINDISLTAGAGNTRVGIATDPNEIDYAFWAGWYEDSSLMDDEDPDYDPSKLPPFYVKHNGEISAELGRISCFYFADNKLYTDSNKKTIDDDDVPGIYVGDDGIAISSNLAFNNRPQNVHFYRNGLDKLSAYNKTPTIDNISLYNTLVAIHHTYDAADLNLAYAPMTVGSQCAYLHVEYLIVPNKGLTPISEITLSAGEILEIPYIDIGTSEFYDPFKYEILQVLTTVQYDPDKTPGNQPSNPINAYADNDNGVLYIHNRNNSACKFYMLIVARYDINDEL